MPYTESGVKDFHISRVEHIIVDWRFALTKDEEGSTLIPPTLLEFANTFSGDLKSILGLDVPVSQGSWRKNSIYLTVGHADEFLDAAGQKTSEGYALSTGEDGIVISGASPLGVWWGTRTILQQVALHDGSMPAGSGRDSPGWKTRGMMIDAGRHFYPKDFIIEMCAYMSYFKQNTFQLHLSDNLSVEPQYSYEQIMELYARFRLWSDSPDLAGLAKYKNESYTRSDFEEIQTQCAARGVTILPDIEAPGHALPIVQWRPQLGFNGSLSLLNITHPETIPTMELIWGHFLPWFHSKVVSIGADEYTGPAEDYNSFVNTLDNFIGKSGKSIRIWATFPPVYNSTYVNIYQNVSIQHEAEWIENPLTDYIYNNYSVLNSNNDFYIVNKWSPSTYANTIILNRTFEGSPSAGPWYPYMFSQSVQSDNPPRNNPLILGAIDVLWNDFGYNTSVFLEAYYAWREGIPALADKHWGGNLTADQFDIAFPALHPHIPAQNLDRAIPSKDDTIFDYEFHNVKHGVVSDRSKNRYNGLTNCRQSSNSALSITPRCYFETPWASKGRNYTLNLSLKVDKLDDPTNTTIITGQDSALMLTPEITLFASGNYYRLNSTLPMNKWVDLSIMAVGNQTFATVAATRTGKVISKGEFLTVMGINGDYLHTAIMGIEAPIKTVTGWTGELSSLRLTGSA